MRSAQLDSAVDKRPLIRRSKIKRSPSSYRPGSLPPDTAANVSRRELELRFIVPTSSELGTDDELAAATAFRDGLRTNTEFVRKAGLSQDTNVLTIRCHVFAIALSDDQLLTSVFLRLKPLIDSCDMLQRGFCETKPYWQAVKGGDFVADEGPIGSTSEPDRPAPLNDRH